MAPSNQNQPQPTPESGCPHSRQPLDGPPASSRDGVRPGGTSSGHHRSPSTPESDRPWGLSPAAAADILPGEPPVRVSYAWTPSPADPPVGEAELFTGLTPRVAAMLVVTYTRPGDTVIDTTADLALEGTTAAGSRQYQRRAATPAPTSQCEQSRYRASLVVLRWPTEPTPETGCHAARQLPTGADLEAALITGRRLAAPNANLVVVSGPASSGGYRDRARELIQALRATGGGRLRHVVLVGHGPDDDADQAPLEAPGHVAVARLDLIVFVVSLRAGSRHD